jgi:hypothetical protein
LVVWVNIPTVAVTEIVNVPEGVGDWMTPVADAYFVTSAWDIAETVTVGGFGNVVGAV